MSSYSEGQTHQLMEALEVGGFSAAEVTKLGQCGNSKLNEIRLVLNGQAKIVLVVQEPPTFQEPLDLMVHVDRTVRPVYPDWMKKVLHPELENTGPVEYDANTIQQWLHDDQKTGVIGGKKLYEHLKKEKMLESCLSLRDLEEICRKGIVFFRKHFQGKAPFAWKSVVRDRGDDLSVPYLVGYGGEVVVRWRWLGHDWRAHDPALRFAK